MSTGSDEEQLDLGPWWAGELAFAHLVVPSAGIRAVRVYPELDLLTRLELVENVLERDPH